MTMVNKPFGDIITFSRASGGGRFNPSGVYEWLGNDVPRIDYDPVTGECRGLLIEDQRTRLNTVSAEPSAAQSVAVSAVAQTISFYGAGSVVLSGAHVASLTGAGAYPARREVTFTPTAGTLTITPTGDVRMLQLEAGAFATSAIVGEGSQVTRAADIASVNELSPWLNASEGALLLDMVAVSNRAASGTFALSVGTSSAEYIGLAYVSASLGNRGVYASGGGGTANVPPPGPFAAGERVKIAAGYAADGTISAAADGAFSGSKTLTSGNAPAFAIMHIGRGFFSDKTVNYHIRSIRYFPRRLSDESLIELTTP